MRSELIQRAADLLANAGRPFLAVGRGGGLAGEVRVVGVRGQGHVQLAKALPQQVIEILQLVQRAVLVFHQRHATCQLVAHGTIEGVQRPLPGITLVIQEALHHHQGVLLAFPVEATDLAEHRRNVGEALLGQETPHLQLRMHAGENTPQHLDHHLVADDRRAVGLLRRGVTHLDPFRQLDVRQLWQRLETDFPFTAAQHLLVAQALDDAQHELLEGEGVGQQSHLRATANTRDGQLLRQRRTEVGLGEEPQRQLVEIGMAGGLDGDLAEQHRALRIAERHAVADFDRVDRGILVGEPASFRQVGRQRIVLQDALATAVQRIQALEHQGLEVRHDIHRCLVPARHLVRGRQLEPVEAVGRQRQQIRQLADGRERTAPDHLHRHHAGVMGKLQLGRLGRTGDVGHAEDDFGFAVDAGELAQVGQDSPVARRQHLQRAATEGLELLADRQQTPGPVEQRMRVALLRLDVDRLVAVQRVHDRRQHQAGRIGAGKTAVAIRRPLHRRANAIAVAEEDVVAHADLVAVVDHRRAGHG